MKSLGTRPQGKELGVLKGKEKCYTLGQEHHAGIFRSMPLCFIEQSLFCRMPGKELNQEIWSNSRGSSHILSSCRFLEGTVLVAIDRDSLHAGWRPIDPWISEEILGCFG